MSNVTRMLSLAKIIFNSQQCPCKLVSYKCIKPDLFVIGCFGVKMACWLKFSYVCVCLDQEWMKLSHLRLHCRNKHHGFAPSALHIVADSFRTFLPTLVRNICFYFTFIFHLIRFDFLKWVPCATMLLCSSVFSCSVWRPLFVGSAAREREQFTPFYPRTLYRVPLRAIFPSSLTHSLFLHLTSLTSGKSELWIAALSPYSLGCLSYEVEEKMDTFTKANFSDHFVIKFMMYLPSKTASCIVSGI